MKCMNGCLVFKLDDEQLKSLVKATITRLSYLTNATSDEVLLNKAESDKDFKEYMLDSWKSIKEMAKTLNEIDKEINIKKCFGFAIPFDGEMTRLITESSIETLYEYGKIACAKRKALESTK